jgi:hypothetical protein
MRSLSWMMSILICLLSFAVMAPSAQACSGGAGETIDRLLEWTQIAVKARPVMVDSVRQNGILAVESYLIGGPGPAFLLFSQNSLPLIEKITDGTGTCDFLQRNLYVGEVGYYFLERRADGAYVSARDWTEDNYVSFPQPDSTISLSLEESKFSSSKLTVQPRRQDSMFSYYELGEEAFVSFLAEMTGKTATAPDNSLPYPRYAPLKIETTDGTQYMLPVDTDIPIEVTDELIRTMTMLTMGVESPDWNQQVFRPTVCPGPDCVPISPNGIYWVVPGASFVTIPYDVPTQAFLFAPTSDALATWTDTDLIVSGVGSRYSRHTPFVRSIPLVSAPDSIGQAAWSSDGQQLAYSDAQGLWLLNVYAPEIAPRLLLATQGETIPLARAFSPLGRYLSIENGKTWQNLDLVTGRYLPSGVFSPDERVLLAYNPAKLPFTLEICALMPVMSCQSARDSSYSAHLGEYIPADQFRAVIWRDSSGFLSLVCANEDIGTCFVDYRHQDSETSWWAAVVYEGAMGFAYEPHYDDMVVMTGEKHITINNQIYDLSASLSTRIVSVEWLPGMFYWR